MDQPRKILVRAPNWTGDVAMATPGFRALRAGFPAASITAHVRPGLEALLAGSPWFDEVIPVRSYHRGIRAIWAEGRELRRKGFDLGLSLPDSFSAALLLRIAGARPIVGYRRSGRGILLDRALDPPRGPDGGPWVAREEHVLGLVESLGCARQGLELELFVTPEERAAAESVAKDCGVDLSGPIAALAPGASYGSSKLWPAESFAKVGDELSRAGHQVLVLGTPAERELTGRVCAAMAAPAADLGGRLDLGGLKAILQPARVLVCNDAGARHIAVAFGVPSVVMMGPTSIEKTALNLERVQVLTADVPCRPCYHRECPIDHRCMTRISPERVGEAARAASGDASSDVSSGMGKS